MQLFTKKQLLAANLAVYLIIIRYISPIGTAKFGVGGRKRLTDEERLNEMIFRNYDPSFRPVYNASEPVEIVFGLNIITISKMDEINQILELSVWLEMYWKDKRLTWTPSDFSGLEMVRLPTKMLWSPDIVLYNSAEEFRLSGEVRAMVAHTGEIFVGPYVKLRSTCILDLTLYPFDDQLCRLIFGSWSYDLSQLVVISNSQTPVLTQYVDSAVWDLLESRIEETRHAHSCCPHPFSDIVVSIRMRRRFLYNSLLNIFIPTLWLTLLTLLTFWLDPASGEKITLCITILVTFTLFQLLVAEQTPRTSDFVPLIGLYLTTSYLTTGAVCGLQVFILNLHGLSPILIAVPHWLRCLVLNVIAKVLCIKVDFDQPTSFMSRKRRQSTASVTSKKGGQHQQKSPTSSVRSKRRAFQRSSIYNMSNCNPRMSMASLSNADYQLYRGAESLNATFDEDDANDINDSDSDLASRVMKAREIENEHIYMGIEEILEELQPKGHHRFLARDHTLSYQSLSSTANVLVNSAILNDSGRVYAEDDEEVGDDDAATETGAGSSHRVITDERTVYQNNKLTSHASYSRQYPVCDSPKGSIGYSKHQQQQVHRRVTSSKYGAGSANRNSYPQANQQQPPMNLARSRFEQDLLHKLMKSVGYMAKREQSTKMTTLVVAEWRMIAFVLDRLLFWLFAVFTFTFVIVYLFALPMSEHAVHRHNLSVATRKSNSLNLNNKVYS